MLLVPGAKATVDEDAAARAMATHELFVFMAGLDKLAFEEEWI